MQSPEEKALIGRISAYDSWARTPDRAARTAPARRAAEARFEKLVDPNNQLTPAERAKRAEYAKKAHFTRMALKSVQVRRARKRGPLDRIAELDALAAGGVA